MPPKPEVIPAEGVPKLDEILPEAADTSIVEIEPGTGVTDAKIVSFFLNPQHGQDRLPTPHVPDEEPTTLENQEKVQGTFRSSADPHDVAAMLTRLRTTLAMSKVATAAAMGKGEKAVRDIESGAYNPTLPKIDEYADALGYEVRIELIPKGRG